MKPLLTIGGVVLACWLAFAGISYLADAPAREHAEATWQSSESRPDQSNPWLYFFWGYVLNGGNSYTVYRDQTNETYRATQPRYDDVHEQADGQSGQWGRDSETGGDVGESGATTDGGDWSAWGWDVDDEGSWGSDDSWDWGSGSGSWDSGSSWSSDYDSGSWGGSDWSSSGSGSWGD